MTKQEIILANQQYLFPSVFHYFKEPLVITRAKDQHVWDIDGNNILISSAASSPSASAIAMTR